MQAVRFTFLLYAYMLCAHCFTICCSFLNYLLQYFLTFSAHFEICCARFIERQIMISSCRRISIWSLITLHVVTVDHNAILKIPQTEFIHTCWNRIKCGRLRFDHMECLNINCQPKLPASLCLAGSCSCSFGLSDCVYKCARSIE